WLEADLIRVVRDSLTASHPDVAAHFMPHFVPPPAPVGVDRSRWPRIAEHVARAERVSQVVRDRGLDAALARFGDSQHAVELAALIAAALQAERLTYGLLVTLLACEIDDLVAYGVFLDLLQRMDRVERERALGAYERFCDAFAAMPSDQPMWGE